MRYASITIAILLLPIFWSRHGIAQESSEPVEDTGKNSADSASAPTDPVGQPFRMGNDEAVKPPSEIPPGRILKSESFFTSPTGTLLKSVAFPGWGQWANGKKQKAAIYFGIETYWITKSVIWRHRARTAENLSNFTRARDRRNYFYWLTGITVFVSMFDAYADRYLLTLERTRDMPDDFWGDRFQETPDEDWRLTLAIKF